MSEKLTREAIEGFRTWALMQQEDVEGSCDGEWREKASRETNAICDTALTSLEPSAEREAGFAEGTEAAAKVCWDLAMDKRKHAGDMEAEGVPANQSGLLKQAAVGAELCYGRIRALSQPRANGDANG